MFGSTSNLRRADPQRAPAARHDDATEPTHGEHISPNTGGPLSEGLLACREKPELVGAVETSSRWPSGARGVA